MSAVLWGTAVGAGLGSAVLWFWSALVPIPNKPIWIQAHAGGGGTNPEIERLTAGLRRQSRLNAAAALLAAVAVLAQVGQQFMTH